MSGDDLSGLRLISDQSDRSVHLSVQFFTTAKRVMARLFALTLLLAVTSEAQTGVRPPPTPPPSEAPPFNSRFFPPPQGGSDGRKVADGCVMRDEERRDSWDHVFMLNAYECESRGFCWAVHEMCARASFFLMIPAPPLTPLHPLPPLPHPDRAARASPGATLRRVRALPRLTLAPLRLLTARSAPRRASPLRKRFARLRAAAGCRASPGSPGAFTPRAAASRSQSPPPRQNSPWRHRRLCPRQSLFDPPSRRRGGCRAGCPAVRAPPALSCEGGGTRASRFSPLPPPANGFI
jgi:hypothetical protein